MFHISAKIAGFKLALMAMVSVSLSAGFALALVPEEQQARLDGDLTPLGSERAGNADGTIPAWTGGLTSPPKGIGYEKGNHLPDPFADDKVLFTVNAKNADQYDDYITRGQRALMERHNSYFLNVYPSRRSCAHPEHVYKAARRNAAVGELVADGNGVSKAIMASPFPVAHHSFLT